MDGGKPAPLYTALRARYGLRPSLVSSGTVFPPFQHLGCQAADNIKGIMEREEFKIEHRDHLVELLSIMIGGASTRPFFDGDMVIEKCRDDDTGWYDEVTIRARFTN